MSKVLPKVSVIVPMYNVEDYLDECVQSIRLQTLSDIEIILVDDGSPDRCGEMADEYAKFDARIKVVHRSNGGLGPARNSGLEIATGEYIGFVDSDDWIEPDMFSNLYSSAISNNSDIVFTGFKRITNGICLTTQEHPFAGKVLVGQKSILSLRASFYGAPAKRIREDPVPISVWCGIYKRSLIVDNKIQFLNVRSEDKFFNTYACRAAEVVSCVAGTPYCYRKDNQPSITHTFTEDTIYSYLELFHSLKILVNQEKSCNRSELFPRFQRCVIDYSRVLARQIVNSSLIFIEKRDLLFKLFNQSIVRDCLCGYRWWALPFGQMVFYLLVLFRCVSLSILVFTLEIKND